MMIILIIMIIVMKIMIIVMMIMMIGQERVVMTKALPGNSKAWLPKGVLRHLQHPRMLKHHHHCHHV